MFAFWLIGEGSRDNRLLMNLTGDLDRVCLGAILLNRDVKGLAVPDDELTEGICWEFMLVSMSGFKSGGSKLNIC